MVYFNLQDRCFAIDLSSVAHKAHRLNQRAQIAGRKGLAHARSASANQWGLVTGLGNVAINARKRANLKKEYMAQGMTSEEAAKAAKKQTPSMMKSYLKGHVTGAGIKLAGNALGVTKATGRDKLIVAKQNLRNAKQAHAAKLINAENLKRAKNIQKQIKTLK